MNHKCDENIAEDFNREINAGLTKIPILWIGHQCCRKNSSAGGWPYEVFGNPGVIYTGRELTWKNILIYTRNNNVNGTFYNSVLSTYLHEMLHGITGIQDSYCFGDEQNPDDFCGNEYCYVHGCPERKANCIMAYGDEVINRENGYSNVICDECMSYILDSLNS